MDKEGFLQTKSYMALPRHVQVGLRKAVANEKPFLAGPFNWVAKKILKDPEGKKVDKFYWRYLQSPFLKADIAAGSLAQKLEKKIRGKTGGFFETKVILPTGKTGKGRTGNVEYAIPTISAPVSKAGKVALPLLGAMKLEEIVGGKKDMSNSDNKITQADLKKTASMLRHLKDQKETFEKKAKATELLFKQAELGQIPVPKTYADFQEKVAELLSKDLNVVEEAIKMAGYDDSTSLGNIDSSHSGRATSPTQMFANAIIDG